MNKFMNKTVKIFIAIIILLVLVIGGYYLDEKSHNESIKIGAVLPISGPIALSGGEQCQIGAMIAVEDVNNSGGIRGRMLELKTEDSQSNNANGATAFRNLLDIFKPIAVISLGSSLSETLSPMAGQEEIPLLATITSDPNLTQNNEFTFRYYPTAKQEISAIIQIVKGESIKKFAVLYLNDDFGRSMLDVLTNSFTGSVVSESFGIGDSDFRTQLVKLKSQNPDALLIVGFASHMTTAVKQVGELDMHPTLFLSSSATVPSVKKAFDDMGATVFAPAPIVYATTTNDRIDALKQKFESMNGSKFAFDHYLASCYDTVMLLAGVLKTNQPTREGIENGLTNLKNFEGLLGEVTVNGREFSFPLYPTELKAGEVMYLSNK